MKIHRLSSINALFKKSFQSNSCIFHPFKSYSIIKEQTTLTPKLKDMFAVRSTETHNIYRHSQNVLGCLTTMDNRCRNIESNNPVLKHDQLTPSILSLFVPDLYKNKEVTGKFAGIGSYLEPYRTLYIDQLLKSFIFSEINDNNQYHIIELGIGFDFRIERILSFMNNTNQDISNIINLYLYEMDLPNIIDIRYALMNEFKDGGNFAENHSKINVKRKTIRKSIFDDVKWIKLLSEDINNINDGGNSDFENVLILSEGLSWCISPIEMENAVIKISKHFKGATFIFDAKLSKEFINKYNNKIFCIQKEYCLLNDVQIKNNVPLIIRLICSLISRSTFVVTTLTFL